jgi:hypothetical protein
MSDTLNHLAAACEAEIVTRAVDYQIRRALAEQPIECHTWWSAHDHVV